MSAVIRRKKMVKRGVSFTLMVVGASGTGRTTFVNTLCGKKALDHMEHEDPANAHLDPSISITPVSVDLDDSDGSRVSLTIVDTPGFGDNVNNEPCFNEILGYLERQYDDILSEETRIRRNPRFRDNRVHCLLYFITPTGHGLRELDIELMKRLSPRVNVIPVIGKADSFTPSELADMKRLVMEDIEHYKIPIYNFPYDVEEDDLETIEENSSLRSMLPFAIVGSEEFFDVNGKKIRGRQYPWGVVEVENSIHSDFLTLKSAILGSHLIDLKEITHDFLYENYRTECLSKRIDGSGPKSAYSSAADESIGVKEEELLRESAKLQEYENKMQSVLEDQRKQLFSRDSELDDIESRLREQRIADDASYEKYRDNGSSSNGDSSH
ncbi:hypothetical protein CANCADRAFT_95192 [Tortispora caseinolytica NRRL Y-17796]|uniref:Septin-type G domain-containing protein n=1 Tax=Tortispora caseinolytica NRRL Y-17796 TaxID=767744 RepID=A0A1E4TMB6_9ASCO|nr:hypothetical protein CANCADRAFT_95192 [Tortispora caseinolytica NRRL Y-17796]